MLIANARTILREAASADLLNPEVSEEVKDVVEELEDVLGNNIEEVDDKDKTTNGGVPVTSDAAGVLESAVGYGSAKYIVTLETVMAIMETEGEEKAEAMTEPGEEEPSAEECEECEPEPTNVIEDIAEKNGVDPDQVTVTINAENASFLADMAVFEAKCGVTNGRAYKKLKKLTETVTALRDGGVKVTKASRKRR